MHSEGQGVGLNKNGVMFAEIGKQHKGLYSIFDLKIQHIITCFIQDFSGRGYKGFRYSKDLLFEDKYRGAEEQA